MNVTAVVLPALLAFCGVALLLALVLRQGRRLLPLDRPNDRSLHANPTPRVGGMAMMAVLVPVALLMIPGSARWVLPMAVLAAVSAIDDVRGLSVVVRLAAQTVAAGWVVLASTDGPIPPVAAVLAWLAVVWMSNLYNFMDGSDGLAGGMALFGFGAYAAAAWMAGDQALAAVSLAVAACAAAFLFFNFHPARVFMGDAGSVPLGLLAAALGYAGATSGHWPFLFPVLVFSPFIADASVTLARRLLRRERIWQAHKSHYYQRLIRMGLGHRRTALLAYLLMATVATASVSALYQNALLPLALVWTAILVALGVLVDNRWRRFPER